MVTVNITVTDEAVQPGVYLGRQGEKQAREIVLDLSAMREKYGAGTATLYHQRSKDPAPYLIGETTGTTLTWTVSETDTVYAGIGYCEVRYTFGTEGLSKSAMFATNVKASLSGDVIIPAATQAWYDALIDYVDEHCIAQEQLAQAVADYIEAHPLEGIPSGGTEGQILVKKTGTDYDAEWGDGLSDLKSALDVVNDSVMGVLTGAYTKPIIGLSWENGGISANGAENNNAYSIRTGFLSLDEENAWVIDPNGSTYRLTINRYKQDGTFVSCNALNDLTTEKRIVLDSSQKIRLVLYNTAQTERATAETFSIRYASHEITYVPSVVQTAIDSAISSIDVAQSRRNATINNFKQRKPLVTIIDDDGYSDFYTRLFDSSGNYLLHAPICTAVEGLKIGATSFMTATQLHTVENEGCEILGHGHTPLAPKIRNPESDPITIEEAEADVIANLQAIKVAGFDPVGYVYPSGSTNVAVREMIAKYYSYACTTIRHVSSSSPYYDRVYNFNCIPHFALNRAQLFTSNNTLRSWSEISSIVSDCVENNGWLILYMHLHKDTEQTATATTLNAIIDNIINAGAEVVTATEAFNVFKNAFQTGDYLGPWNTFGSWGIEYENHTPADAGCALNMIGQWDMPSIKQI